MSETNERSVASTGSVANDPLSACCRHLAHSQHIIEGKNAEIARLRLTDEEREAVAYAVSELDHWTHGSEVIEIANTLRKLLKRLGGDR
jgi:hypothetical protein